MIRQARRALERQEDLLPRLKALAGECGAEVREQKLHHEVGFRARSGVCRAGERHLLILDSNAQADERVDAVIDFLSAADTSRVTLDPDIADLIKGRRR